MAETTGTALLNLTREAVGAIRDMAAAQTALESTCLEGLDNHADELRRLQDRVTTMEEVVRPAIEARVQEIRANIRRQEAWAKFLESTAAQWSRWGVAVGTGLLLGRSPEVLHAVITLLTPPGVP